VILPGILKKKKYEVPMNGDKIGGESPNVKPNPTAQYTRAPMHISNQFLMSILTVFLDLKK
jgi:hypothetical protein